MPAMRHQFLRYLIDQRQRVFSSKHAREIATEINISPSSMKHLLFHLVQDGWIQRLRPGLYALTYPGAADTPIHEFEIATALTHPAAVAFRSALNFHGLSEQTPRGVYLLISNESRPLLRQAIFIEGMEVQVSRVLSRHFFGIRNEWINEVQIPITDPERTLLDGLLRPELCGDFGEVMHGFEQHLPNLNLDLIVDYSLKLGSPVIQRLGWTLEEMGYSDEALISLRNALPKQNYRKLDAQSPDVGPTNRKWMVRVNL